MNKQEILSLIEEEDVEFIRLQFADVFGNLKNIAVTPERFERVLDNRYPFDGAGFFGGRYDFDEDLYLCPDLDTFVILPWRPQQSRVGKFICDICYSDGTPFEMSSRYILEKIVKKAKDAGYTFVVNPECEFFLFHTDDNGSPTTISHEKAGYLEAGPSDFGENARRDMVLMLQDMGFRIEASHHEKAPGQHEISFSEGEAFKTADDIMTFKFAIRSIAKRFGLYATFMPKPLQDVAGSGMHLDFSVFKDGKNIFEDENGMPDEAKYFIGGIMKYAPAMCAITNPIVNSYKRILTGFSAPRSIYWAKRGEKALIKFHKDVEGTKVELRHPDSASNPYLAIAVCIAAGMKGIEEKMDPGEENVICDELLPGDLNSAIALFERDALMKEVLGEEFVKIYSQIKKNEWNDYMMQVSDWEIDRYLGKL